MTSQPWKQATAIHKLPISQDIKAIRQWNLVSWKKITWETFKKNDTQNVMQKIFPSSFLKNQNWAYLWIIFNLCYIERYGNILKLSCRAFAFTSYKAF